MCRICVNMSYPNLDYIHVLCILYIYTHLYKVYVSTFGLLLGFWGRPGHASAKRDNERDTMRLLSAQPWLQCCFRSSLNKLESCASAA